MILDWIHEIHNPEETSTRRTCGQELVPAHFRDLIYQEATCGTEWQFARKMKFPKGTGAVKPPSIAGRQGGDDIDSHYVQA